MHELGEAMVMPNLHGRPRERELRAMLRRLRSVRCSPGAAVQRQLGAERASLPRKLPRQLAINLGDQRIYRR